jgi:NAD(P)-dependent dehydrogenase (short-subunit alcohol dehydrogenase family)
LEGFYISAYGTSKMLLNYWSRFILTRQISPTQTTIAMSPGHCSTDMGGEKALRSPLDGAMTIYDHLEGNFSSTLFYHLGKPYDFSDCGPHEK